MELDRLLTACRRRWYLLGAVVAFGVALGLLGESGRVDRFVAQASVQVASDRNVYGSDEVLQRIVVNEMDFITSLDLRTAVVDAVDVGGIDPRTNMTVAQRTDTDIVDLRVEAPDENAAIAAVNFWAETWLSDANARKTAALDRSIAEVQSQLAEAEAKLAASDRTVDLQLRSSIRLETIADLFAANPQLASEQERLNGEVRTIRGTIQQLQNARSKISPFSIVSAAAAPATNLRSGNGLGPVHGAIIGLGIALAMIVALERSTISARSAALISPTFWPTDRTPPSTRVSRIAQEILRTASDERMQLIACSSAGGWNPSEELQGDLARHFAERGFDVTVMTDDDDLARQLRSTSVETLSRSRLSDVIELARKDHSDLGQSIVFANLSDLWFQRSLVQESAVVALIDLRLGADGETVTAGSISQARALTPAVLTVAA